MLAVRHFAVAVSDMLQSLVRTLLPAMVIVLSACALLQTGGVHAQGLQVPSATSTPVAPPVANLRPPPDDPDPPAPYDAATGVSISAPSTMAPGSTAYVTVTIRNSGTTTWYPGLSYPYRLGSQNPQDNTTWGVGRVDLGSTVAPGGQAVFGFTITAPATPGTYTFGWAMLREGMYWFGGNIASTITVAVPAPVYDAQLVSASVPATMTPGGGYNVSMTFRNSGNTTWTSPDFMLATPDDNVTFGLARVAMSPSTVAPGQNATFNFQVSAPSSGGTYTFQWGMVWEFHLRFGQTSTTSITVGGTNGSVTYIHTDGLGSPVARTDSAGNVISRTRYEPYGYVASGVQPTLGFTGHVNDVDTGLTYMQQRYYDPVAGRFLSIDPVTTDANNGGSFNRYAYANNSPYKYVDPDGRSWALAGRGAILGAEGGFAVCGPWCSAAGAVIVGGAALYAGEKALTWIASSGEKKDTLKPGPYAGDSIPARGPDRDFTREERDKINEIGSRTGCHTCGSKDPGTKSGDHVLDHQPANGLNPEGGEQRLYPHCLTCSRVQGGQVRAEQSRKPAPEPKPEKKQEAN